MEAQIIKFLKSQPNTDFRPIEIARALHLKRAKEVNPKLYKLHREGKIVKICDPDGSHPTWQILPSAVNTSSSPIGRSSKSSLIG